MLITRLPKYFYSTITLLVLAATFLLITLSSAPLVESAISDHVVISEVMIEGDSSNDEFVELYNPTDTLVDMEGWRLRRTSASGSTGSNLVSSISGSINAHSYFLIAHPDFDGVSVDLPYSATSSGIANHNTVILETDENDIGERTEIDKVGLGDATNFEGAGTVDNPIDGGSVERKAFSTSTSQSMGVGGDDENMGNGEDSDDNAADFVQRAVSDPQNSSVTEIPVGPTPSPSPSPSPSPTISPTPTTTPTPSPSPTLTPTLSPSPTPTVTTIPSPSPAIEPTPSISPSPTPTEFPSFFIGGFFFPNRVILCRLVYKPVRFGFWWSYFPTIECSR